MSSGRALSEISGERAQPEERKKISTKSVQISSNRVAQLRDVGRLVTWRCLVAERCWMTEMSSDWEMLDG